MGVSGQRHAPAALPPGMRRGTHFTGGWVGPRVGVEGYGKSRLHWDSIPVQNLVQNFCSPYFEMIYEFCLCRNGGSLHVFPPLVSIWAVR
jgi:hypothetical protein